MLETLERLVMLVVFAIFAVWASSYAVPKIGEALNQKMVRAVEVR